MLIDSCSLESDNLVITFSDKNTADFSLFWLRDHSTDSVSLNPSTLQREFQSFAEQCSAQLAEYSIIEGGSVIEIHWEDADLVSKYEAEFLHRMAFKLIKSSVYQLWGNELQDKIPSFDYSKISGTDASFLPVLEAIESYGIAKFSNVPTNMQATQKLLEKIGYIRETVFGGLWNFSNNEAHNDSAYTSAGIGLHTDGTYALDPPGLQLLHCLAFDGTGGFNQFVDGFKVAQIIKDEDPEAFQTLTSIKVPAHYIEPTIQLRAKHEVIREDVEGHYEQICFNNFDRSPFKLRSSDQAAFYHAYAKFQHLVNDPQNQIRLQLIPGSAVWFDNWRILHARTAFTGFRHLAGGYTNREDLISKKLTLRGRTPWKD
jgi:trimethyllysine dioxygenase